MYRSQRSNPLVRSTAGGRVLSALQLPAFLLRPPPGYGVITTSGCRTGKRRRKCIRIIRRGDRAYIVSIPGARAAWLANIRANPRVKLRVPGATLEGTAREPADDEERANAIDTFCEACSPFDYLAFSMHWRGRPTRTRIRQLLRTWCEQGTPLVVEIESPS